MTIVTCDNCLDQVSNSGGHCPSCGHAKLLPADPGTAGQVEKDGDTTDPSTWTSDELERVRAYLANTGLDADWEHSMNSITVHADRFTGRGIKILDDGHWYDLGEEIEGSQRLRGRMRLAEIAAWLRELLGVHQDT